MTNQSSQLLVDFEWLVAHADDVRILDARLLSQYMNGHIPGAVHFDLDLVVKDDGHFSVIGPELMQDLLEECGITPNTTVVIYDNSNSFEAARLFWTLEYFGHQDVRILDGGIVTWRRSRCPVSKIPPIIERAVYPQVNIDPTRRVSTAWIAKHLDDEALSLVDTRSTKEHTGEAMYSFYGGHIPNSVHIDWQHNFYQGLYLSAEDLTALYAQIPNHNHVVAYCQAGYRAAVAYVALRVLGYASIALYDASWSEWGDRHDLPITTLYRDEAET